MRISIHQPAYLPWMGYFDKIVQSDLFVYLDHVQFQKNSFQNRNKIKAANGPAWLTVPVLTKGVLYETPLSRLEIDNRQRWQKKHFSTLRQSYAKASNVDFLQEIEVFYTKEQSLLSDLCLDMLKTFMNKLKIKTPIIRSSDIVGLQDYKKSDLILNICSELGASEYLSGSMGREYLDLSKFADANISVLFQNFSHPIYPQAGSGDIFLPYLGIVDLICNVSEPAKWFPSSRPENDVMRAHY